MTKRSSLLITTTIFLAVGAGVAAYQWGSGTATALVEQNPALRGPQNFPLAVSTMQVESFDSYARQRHYTGLVGVAINDTIVVLAAIREDPQARVGEPAAVRDVVVRSTRHVLSTTLTTVAGFTPLMLAGGV